MDMDNPFLTRKQRERMQKIEVKNEPDKINSSKGFHMNYGKAVGKDARPKRVGFKF